MRSDLDLVSACASVLATTKSTPCKACRDHVVDGITAGAADPEHGNARLHLANIGDVTHVYFTIGHGLLPTSLAVCFHYGPGRCLEQLHHQAIGALALKVCPVIRRPCFEPRDLRLQCLDLP